MQCDIWFSQNIKITKSKKHDCSLLLSQRNHNLICHQEIKANKAGFKVKILNKQHNMHTLKASWKLIHISETLVESKHSIIFLLVQCSDIWVFTIEVSSLQFHNALHDDFLLKVRLVIQFTFLYYFFFLKGSVLFPHHSLLQMAWLYRFLFYTMTLFDVWAYAN